MCTYTYLLYFISSSFFFSFFLSFQLLQCTCKLALSTTTLYSAAYDCITRTDHGDNVSQSPAVADFVINVKTGDRKSLG